MSVHSRALAILLLAACVQRPSVVGTAPEATPVGREAIAASPAAGSGSGAAPDPQSLYEGCRERVEGTETDHECTADADCVKTGCSSELCIAKSVAEGVMSTCEVRTCFQILESCTCQEGRCRWVVGLRTGPLGAGSMDVQ